MTIQHEVHNILHDSFSNHIVNGNYDSDGSENIVSTTATQIICPIGDVTDEIDVTIAQREEKISNLNYFSRNNYTHC